MNTPIFFRRTFQDPVVEYYFLPGRRDVRLTIRFGTVLVHREFVIRGNNNWEQEPFHFPTLSEAEEYALNLVTTDEPSNYFNSARNRKNSVVREDCAPYWAA